MRWLPREHGATVIWLASVVLALLTLPEVPDAIGSAVFALGSLTALLLLAWLTSRSAVLVRLERNPVLTPVLSSPLTLIVPFGRLVMIGDLPPATIGLWLVFLTYTTTGVVYTGDAVRAVVRGSSPGWGLLLLSAAFVVAMALVLSAVGWLPTASLVIVVPLLAHRLAAGPSRAFASLPRPQRIRRLGVAQSANMLAAAVLLAAVLRL